MAITSNGTNVVRTRITYTPNEKGFFCVSTSYRQEPNAKPGRHEIIFPMFEFEMPGDVDDLKDMEIELCEHLGFPELKDKTYRAWASEFEVEELDHEHEEKIGNGIITHFPEFTSPFWNMSRNDDGVTSRKIRCYFRRNGNNRIS